MSTQQTDTLIRFLNTPLDSGDAIWEQFAALPGAVVGKGEHPLQRYVYIPGTREDRVVLVAHMDTVWDKGYQRPFSAPREVIFEDGVFKSSHPDCGIGADDRAGCAILWELRNSGHSILVTDGEEKGKHGANYLKKHDQALFRELNSHRYMMEFDWKGTNCCLFNQVDNSKKFKRYIATVLGFADSKCSGGTDLGVLCSRICGVNVGIGYEKWHSPQEQLVLADWENTLDKVRVFLEKPQPKFPTDPLQTCFRLTKQCVRKLLKPILKKSKHNKREG